MVRAILAGTKVQTRRIVKPQPKRDRGVLIWASGKHSGFGFDGVDVPPLLLERCPYGVVGDRLWVRETSRAHELTDKEALDDTFGVMERLGLEEPLYGLDGVLYAADGTFREIENTREASDKWMAMNAYRGKKGATVPPIHMPRWACRLELKLDAVRVQRLQDISDADARAEGVDEWGRGALSPEGQQFMDPRDKFECLWSSINGRESWNANPWVWVLSFKRVPN